MNNSINQQLLDALKELRDWHSDHTGLPACTANAAIAAAEQAQQAEPVALTNEQIEDLWWGELDNRSLGCIRNIIAAAQPPAQTEHPRCACGDSFTADAMCANCIAAAGPVARDVLMAAMHSLHEALIDVYHESVGHSSVIEKKMRSIDLDAIVDRYAAQTPAVAVPDDLFQRAENAIAYSYNFATAKPDIGSAEREHIIGLCNVLRAMLAAAPKAVVAVPDGYALVPVEPTPEMVSAGAEGDSQFYEHAGLVYRAMLAAAQKGDQHDE